MDDHFNGLTPSQAERLAILIEEAAEVQQAATKILRHGYEFTHPRCGTPNRAQLTTELGHLAAAAERLANNYDVDWNQVMDHRRAKEATAELWMHHPAEGALPVSGSPKEPSGGRYVGLERGEERTPPIGAPREPAPSAASPSSAVTHLRDPVNETNDAALCGSTTTYVTGLEAVRIDWLLRHRAMVKANGNEDIVPPTCTECSYQAWRALSGLIEERPR